jgi:dGTPase
MNTIREQSEAREDAYLSPFAARSRESRGRRIPIAPCDIRTEFQRDRDRILHSKSFRRLKGKTQVFLAPKGDHYRTRLTHTLEVAQIARTVSRGLGLNEDLTEAIALGHDLGHPPFGHAGEAVLDAFLPAGWRHYEQSLRVVEFLENEGAGLNLTYETLDGIGSHSKGAGAITGGSSAPQTREGVVVRFADVIAYLNHDIDDALRADILRIEDIPRETLAVLGASRGERIGRMVTDVIASSANSAVVTMSRSVLEATESLKAFMYATVYPTPVLMREVRKAQGVLDAIVRYFSERPELMPDFYRAVAERDGVACAVCDFVAGMTDGYALNTYRSLFIPEVLDYV